MEKLNFISTGLNGQCAQCQSDWGMEPREFYNAVERHNVICEGSFSWHPCELCNTNLGGLSYVAHGRDMSGDLVHFRICQDCLINLEC